MTRHSLVVRLDSAGDVLLAGPAVRAVAETAEVTMLVGPRGAEAAALLPGVRQIVVWQCPWVVLDPPPVRPAELHQIADRIRRLAIDDAVVLTSAHQSPLPTALLLRLAGVARITGASSDYPGSLLDVRWRPEDQLHEVERACRIAAAAGYLPDPDDDGRLAVRHPLPAPGPRAGSPYVVVHPGASAPARTCSAGRWRRIVEELGEHGHHVLITGAPSERHLTRAVAAAGAADLGGCTSLRELASVLAGAAVVITGNTGPAHLAAAVRTPVVSLFAPLVPLSAWRPYGVPHVVLGEQNAACAGTRAVRCPVEGHPCLDRIPHTDVVDAVEQLVGGTA